MILAPLALAFSLASPWMHSTSVTVESVMRWKDSVYAKPSILNPEKKPSPAEQLKRDVPAYLPPAELPPGEKLALLTMRRGELALIVAERMKGNGVFFPDMRDYRSLASRGYCRKNPGERYHYLTTPGIYAADTVALAGAKQFGLHYLRALGNHRAYKTFACTCGKWSTMIQRGDHTAGNAALGFDRHVEEANSN